MQALLDELSRRDPAVPDRAGELRPAHCRLTLVAHRLERQRHRVHAVAVTGRRLRRVVEEVTQVGVTDGAPHLGADHAVAAVFQEPYGVRAGGVVERRPAAVRLELGLRAEQLVAAGSAAVNTDPVLLEERAGPRPLRAGLAEDGVLLGGELGAPLLVGLLHLVRGHRPDRATHPTHGPLCDIVSSWRRRSWRWRRAVGSSR